MARKGASEPFHLRVTIPLQEDKRLFAVSPILRELLLHLLVLAANGGLKAASGSHTGSLLMLEEKQIMHMGPPWPTST